MSNLRLALAFTPNMFALPCAITWKWDEMTGDPMVFLVIGPFGVGICWTPA